MHVHVSAIEMLKVFAYVIIAGFFWRIGEIYFKDTALGKAMMIIY